MYIKSMMPLMILAGLVLLFVTKESTLAIAHSPAGIKWISLPEALNLAEKEQKPILIDIYTDWCGWCKKMDKESFTDAQIVDYVNQHYYAVKLDAESDAEIVYEGKKITYRQLASQIFKVSAYPSLVYINTRQQSTTVPGYQVAKDLIAYLRHFNGDN